jgi:hypothetical protein
MKSKLLLLLTIIALLSFQNNSFAQSPNLGAASSFALFTAAGELTNVGASVVTGDVGTYVGALTGFPPGIVIGEIYPVGHPILAQAAIDLGLAYTDLASRPCDVVLGTPFGNGQTINPGVYCLGSAATLNGELILDGLGNPDALFIIQIDGALATSGNSSITLINGASIDNVYWQINGAFTLGEGSVFRGIIVANGQIELLEASTLYGQALSIAGAILLHNNLVTIPMPPEAPEVTVIQPDCFVPTGTITVNSPLGPGFTYSIGAGYQSSTIFSSLAPGTYNVTVMSADGLISESISVTINAQPITPPPPEVVALQPDCFINTGTISITSPLGPGFTYSIGGAYQSNPVFTEVLPNSYNVTVMSEDGCISPATIVIIEPSLDAPLAPQVVALQPDCFINTGTITITSPIGPGLMYSIGGAYQSNPVFTEVLPNSYNVTVMSEDGCISPATIVIIEPSLDAPLAPQVVALQPDCFINTGTITVTSPIGPGLMYSIGGAYQSNPVFTEVLPNSYNVTVMSEDGCISPATIVIIEPSLDAPLAPQVVALQPDCFINTGTITITSPIGPGLMYSIGGAYQSNPVFTEVLPNSYNVTVMSEDGCISPATIVIIEPSLDAPLAPQVVALQPDCFINTGTITITSPIGPGLMYSIGGAYQSNPVFTEVLPNSYNVTVMSEDGCISPATIVIIEPSLDAPLAPQVVALQPDCFINTGTITITSPIGPGLMYSIGGAYQSNPVFTEVLPNSYNVTVMSEDGCISPATIVIIEPSLDAPLAPQVVALQPDCFINTGTITITSPIGPGLMYSIGGAYQSNPVFTEVLPNSYNVTVMSEDGCISRRNHRDYRAFIRCAAGAAGGGTSAGLLYQYRHHHHYLTHRARFNVQHWRGLSV